jgi:hypothetical protein
MKSHNRAVVEPRSHDLYDEDFLAWTEQTAALLRRSRFAAIDVAHLAEEVEDMGKRDLREATSRLRVLLVHLLKWRHQPTKRSRSWRSTIVMQRQEIADLLEQSPSLRRKLSASLAATYRAAVERAVAQTKLEETTLDPLCPFTLTQILDPTFLPD